MSISLATWQNQLLSNSVVRINGNQYLNIKITTKSQLLQSDYSHYNSYQEFLYNLVLTLKDKGLGYRKISHYLNMNGYKSVRGKVFKNGHIQSLLNKGRVRKERIDNLKSHKDYGYKYELSLSEV